MVTSWSWTNRQQLRARRLWMRRRCLADIALGNVPAASLVMNWSRFDWLLGTSKHAADDQSPSWAKVSFDEPSKASAPSATALRTDLERPAAN